MEAYEKKKRKTKYLILDVIEDIWEYKEEKGDFGGYRYINNN